MPPRRRNGVAIVEFGWTDEQLQIGQAAIEFGRKLNSGLTGSCNAASFPHEAWLRCAEFGVQGLPLPENLGGQGADLVTTALVLESLGYGCEDNGLLFSLNAHLWSCALPIWKFGDERKERRYLPRLCDGSMIGVQAVTEARLGLRRICCIYDGNTRRRPLHPQGLEDLHHQRSGRQSANSPGQDRKRGRRG